MEGVSAGNEDSESGEEEEDELFEEITDAGGDELGTNLSAFPYPSDLPLTLPVVYSGNQLGCPTTSKELSTQVSDNGITLKKENVDVRDTKSDPQIL